MAPGEQIVRAARLKEKQKFKFFVSPTLRICLTLLFLVDGVGVR